jgi:hypothetical protein
MTFRLLVQAVSLLSAIEDRSTQETIYSLAKLNIHKLLVKIAGFHVYI